MAARISGMALRNLVARHQGLASRASPMGMIHLSRCLHGGSGGIPLSTLDEFSPAENWGGSRMHCQGTAGPAYWNSSAVQMRLSSTVSGKAVVDEIERISLSDDGEQKSVGRKEEVAIAQPAEHHDLEKLKEKGLVYSSYWGLTPAKIVREDGSRWPWNSFRPWETYSPNLGIDLKKHHVPKTFLDKVAYWTVKALRFPTDVFFQRRYGCRAMMLETVAAVPGMVGGMLLHCKSLRKFQHSGGWIKALIEEAENERMHLMTFMEVANPKWYERALVFTVQGIFFNAYFMLYVLSPKLCHRIVGYLEEEAIHSYTEFLKELDNGNIPNVPAPAIAIDYWRLPKDSTLRDVVMVVRADEAHHRDVNHFASDIQFQGRELREAAAPIGYH